MADIAEHKGIVAEVTDDLVRVKIESVSACAACHAKGLCSMSDKTDKIIDVKRSQLKNEYHVGDEVTVVASSGKGLLAVVFAYIIPAIVAVAAIAVMLSVGANELMASVVAIALVAVYYFVLYLLRDKLNKKFVFTIEE
ncbi:MAG: SoxR reducing system RseC family protein [Bacteroidales bacterium]|nr:SoxR reducing system RseC family protein [Bacteroidales bacterium]